MKIGIRKEKVADMIQGNPEPPFEQKILKELRKWLMVDICHLATDKVG